MKNYYQHIVKLLIVIGLLSYQHHLTAQSSGNDTINSNITKPQFPGGMDSLYKFVAQNFKYPNKASMNEIEGSVKVNFILNKEGKIQNPEVKISIDPGMDKEALRLLKKLSLFQPGTKDGNPIDFEYFMEFNFMRANGLMFKGLKRPLSDTLIVEVTDAHVKEVKKDQLLTFVEQMPEYPGGINSMMNFLSQNIRYPRVASDKGLQGKVLIQFVVDKYGKIGHFKVLRGVGGGCTEEAIRVIKLMPDWIPGKQNGKIEDVFFVLPISFQLK